ncbi:hypothetical protein B5V00_10740 [Geothermobacter hydrogeniphilus]|uniref:Uncharacterized protein n=1 Tax=Geothermobacter hydrogeniphilus TaxID=1969733 RepID=A0A1X0Y1F9_9BACT|nr:hypothetical protein B5V00_10740 [Geothermobacter hydrogeniphilus]
MPHEGEGQAVEAEGPEPRLGPEVQSAVFLNYHGRQVFLRRCPVLFDDGIGIGFEGFADRSQGADNKGIAGGLADAVPLAVPVIDDVELVPLGVGEQLVEIVHDQHVEIEEEDPLPGQSAEIIGAESGLLAVGITVLVRADPHRRFRVSDDGGVQLRQGLVAEEVEVDRTAGVAPDHGEENIDIFFAVGLAPEDADDVDGLLCCHVGGLGMRTV